MGGSGFPEYSNRSAVCHVGSRLCAAGAQPCRPPPKAGLHRRGAPSPEVAQRLRLGDDCEFARPFHPGPQPRPRPANRRCWPPRGQRAVSVDSVCEQDAPGRARWRTSRHQRLQDRKELAGVPWRRAGLATPSLLSLTARATPSRLSLTARPAAGSAPVTAQAVAPCGLAALVSSAAAVLRIVLNVQMASR